jgi:ATP-dependent protease Clp ATPase subunit
MSKEYVTHKVFLESADFHIMIIEYPDTDANDKLALLSPDKGLMYRVFYEDFVLGTCMANSSPFFYHLRRKRELYEKVEEIRAEALELVYRYCPAFLPDNVVINDNNVMKIRSTVGEGEDTRPLTSNALWDQEPPLSDFGPAVITSAPERGMSPENPFLEEGDILEPPMDPDQDDEEGPFVSNEGGDGGRDDVPYELIGHRWKKIGVGLNIRQYEAEENTPSILLGGTPFESARGYHLLVVHLCIEDFSDIFHLLDTMGVTQHTAPPALVEELYEIAVEYNPFLKLENVDLKKIRKEYKERKNSRLRNNRRMSAAGGEDRRVSASRKKKFTDVPKETLLNLSDKLKEHIVGQDEAVDLITDAIQRASVGLKREHEPLGCFLFTGNTGVGKTETAKALSEVLDAPLVRIDCQEYQHSHEVAKLTGSPPGYVGYDEGGHLTKEVAKSPFSIVLFDEIEKAHSNFHERVLQILDDGVLTESKGGKKVSFKQCFVLMTSNIGVKEVDNVGKTMGFGGEHEGSQEKTTKARTEALKKKFKPEFLNRVDDVIHFRLLERGDYLHILDILLAEVNTQISKSRGLALTFSPGSKNFLLDKGIDKKFGARPMRRAIKKYLNTPLARAILAEEISEGSKVTVSMAKDKNSLSFRQSTKKKEIENVELPDDDSQAVSAD